MEVIRHGDILLKKVERHLCGEPELKPELTIALGEISGHHHTLYALDKSSGSEFVEFDEKKYLHIFGNVQLRHQEHKALEIPAGVYEIITEREIDPFLNSIRNVVD